MPDGSTSGLKRPGPTGRDTAPDLFRLVGLHGALVAVPVFLVATVVLALVAGPVPGVLLGVVLAVVAGAALTAVRLRDIDPRVAAVVGARRLGPAEHRRLQSLAENVAMAVGVETPQLFVIESPVRNAVTWGDGRAPLCLAFTTGLLDATDRIELEAVLGRQLAVARDGSVDVLTVASVLFGSLGALDGPVARIARHAVDDRAVVEADLEGVRATGYPPGLVAALEVLRSGTTTVPAVPRALRGACLAAPGDDSGAFDVHPPLADRIDLLREI